jgi:2-keto-3-deoxy-L-rhamnonate aldolase RhmA
MISEMRTPAVGPVLSAAGLDFMILDMEHGAFSFETVNDILLSCRGTRVVPFVRVPELRRECFQKPLDAGALGVLVPRVETREEAETAVRYARYAPEGDRGLSLRRAHGGFRKADPYDFTAAANARIMVMIQIESETGVRNIDSILETPGLDLVFIGPSDTAHSYGRGREAEMREGVLRVVQACANKGVSSGIHHADPSYIDELARHGLRFVSCNTEVGAMIGAFSASAETIRKLCGAAV